ncbi:hypothetical protein Slin15195_G117800 [Septoria linicola]|uniref:Uncharacterized protein n=1 Tax=Septoria linicola TaxID=215465 RepID=A0A9Q9B7D7_9PEZI|nr:hypothetical protein Slin15195_G117800 [Septoria linicola]
MSSYTMGVDPHVAAAPAFSILAEALSTFPSDAPTPSLALSSLSVSQVSRTTQPQPAGTNTKATRIPSFDDPNTVSNDMESLTPAAPTATAIDGGIIPYLATIGSIVVLTGDGYTVTAAIPTANTDALALISATLSPGGDAVTMSDAIYSLGSSGLQIIASETTALLVQSTYGAGQTQLSSDTYGSVSYPTVVTMSTSMSESSSSSSAEETSSTTEASTTSRQTSSATTAAAATTSTEASAGQKQKVIWGMGGMAMLAAVICAL